ncbi:MAG: hypothetical protein MUF84_01435 [Anaerolineae bacterium]|jgi:hypothetical protein|nr:hypothetical protein [Anaerolineae bacterium]
MAESQESIDLVSLFEAAAQAVAAQKDQINALDGLNGNHGDNMVKNVRIMTDALRAHKADPPDEALRFAGAKLNEQGQGGTSQFYSRGLFQAADQLAGKTELKAPDGISLIQSLLGAIPAQGYPKPEETAPSVLDLFMGMAGAASQAQTTPSQQPQQQSAGGLLEMLTGLAGGTAPQPQPQAPQAGGLLDMLTGMTGAGAAQPQPQAPEAGGLLEMLTGLAGTGTPQPQPQPAQPDQGGLDMGDLLGKLLPAGLAYLQAKQSGADSSQAIQAALVSAVLGVQPGQAQTPRQGAGAALAQGMLKALLGRR